MFNRLHLPGTALLLFLMGTTALNGQDFPLRHAHAHNDYEHERPLLDALDNGFVSVEADVYAVNGELYVYHNLPSSPDKDRTLESLYLEPLAERIRSKGSVYPDYDGFFYLMIDFKSEARITFALLTDVLSNYAWMLSAAVDDHDEPGKPVKVFVSGNRPMEQVLKGNKQLMALDGRPEDLDKSISSSLMPVVSQNFGKFSSWKGRGIMKAKDRQRIEAFAKRAHDQGKMIRLWAAPDTREGWAVLLDLGVDLINTDHLTELRQFLSDADR